MTDPATPAEELARRIGSCVSIVYNRRGTMVGTRHELSPMIALIEADRAAVALAAQLKVLKDIGEPVIGSTWRAPGGGEVKVLSIDRDELWYEREDDGSSFSYDTRRFARDHAFVSNPASTTPQPAEVTRSTKEMLDSAYRALAEAYEKGQRSRDAEVERLQRELDEAVTKGLTTNFVSHRETYLKALEAVELVGGILAEDAGAGRRNAHQFYGAAVTKLREGVTPDSLAEEAKAATVTDEQLAEDIEVIENVIRSSGCLTQERLERFSRITAALARGDK